MNKTARLTLIICAVMLVALGLWLLLRSDDAVPAPVTTTVERGDIHEYVLATGILKPASQISVGAQVTGQVKKLYVSQGETVKKGQVLAEIDPTLQKNDLLKAQSQLASARAQLRSDQAQLEEARLALKRQRRLMRDRAGVQSDLEQAESQSTVRLEQTRTDEAQIKEAQITVDTALANLSYTRIVAPVDGEILGIVTHEGQTVVSTQTAPTILVMADLSHMRVEMRISEIDILKVKPGLPLWFSVIAEPDVRYDGVMGATQSAPTDALQENNSNGSAQNGPQQNAVYYTGEFQVDNAQRRLKTWMTAQVFIEIASAQNVLKIPLAALGRQKDNHYQVVVKSASGWQTRWIEAGLDDRHFIEVRSGLRKDDIIRLNSGDTP
jgi:macrolide-specific efflux system membrane fusion protein